MVSRELINEHFKKRGLVPGSHGSIGDPYKFIESALLRKTERFRTKGSAGDIDFFCEYRGKACAIEFKRVGQTIGAGQLGIMKWFADKGAVSWVCWIDERGEIVKISVIEANKKGPFTIYNTTTEKVLRAFDNIGLH